MELRQLNYFIAVVEEGTISGAARALHMSQPPLTAQMHALESELGCALFEHAGRRLRITEANSLSQPMNSAPQTDDITPMCSTPAAPALRSAISERVPAHNVAIALARA